MAHVNDQSLQPREHVNALKWKDSSREIPGWEAYRARNSHRGPHAEFYVSVLLQHASPRTCVDRVDICICVGVCICSAEWWPTSTRVRVFVLSARAAHTCASCAFIHARESLSSVHVPFCTFNCIDASWMESLEILPALRRSIDAPCSYAANLGHA